MSDVEQLREMVRAVAEAALLGDSERAHGCEDEARAFALERIAAGSPHAVELATIALSTSSMDFARWCA